MDSSVRDSRMTIVWPDVSLIKRHPSVTNRRARQRPFTSVAKGDSRPAKRELVISTGLVGPAHPDSGAMQVLRHSKIAVTMEVYTQVPSEVTRAALKRLGESLGEVGR
jgi:hypothetical protein